jgi:CubicO group peptidase (beta-lactamase class C family)
MCKVVENALGKPFRTILEERLFHSSGNTDTISVMLMDDGIAQGVGGISTTLEDFARYAFSYTPSYKRLTGRDGISQAAIDFLFKNKINPEVFAKGNLYAMGQANYGADHPVSAGSLFDFFFEDGAFSKHGHHSQGIYLDPKRDFAGVYFSTQPTGSAENLAAGYMRAISKTL